MTGTKNQQRQDAFLYMTSNCAHEIKALLTSPLHHFNFFAKNVVMKSLKRLRSVVLFFRNKNKTKQKSGRVSLRDAEKIYFSEKFYNDCHKS